MVTPSFIPNSATRGPDADLSSEGYEEVLKDFDDEPTMKKRIPDSDEEGGDHEVKDIGMYLLHLLSFSLHPRRCHLLPFYFHVYLLDFLMQSLFIMRVHLQRFLMSLRLQLTQRCLQPLLLPYL